MCANMIEYSTCGRVAELKDDEIRGCCGSGPLSKTHQRASYWLAIPARYLENTFLDLGPYGPGERLGTASTIEEAKAIAQAAHDKARASTRGESL